MSMRVRAFSILTLSLAALISCAGSARAFDHERKGFVLGLGAGFSPYATLRSSSVAAGDEPVNESSAGFAFQLVIGWAWNERNWLVYEGNVLDRRSETYDTGFGQGFNGIAWYHEYGPRGNAWATEVGAGLQIAKPGSYFMVSTGQPLPPNAPTDSGPGVLLGVGREFVPRWLAMVYASGGTTSVSGADFHQGNLSLLIQYLWD